MTQQDFANRLGLKNPSIISHLEAGRKRPGGPLLLLLRQMVEGLERVGLGERLDHEPSQLSGGQQQRVAIARALANNPPLVLADEPTWAVDSRTTEEILRLFQQLNAEEGITIIIVTHDANVASHGKRVIRIKDGLIQDDGTHPQVLSPSRNGQAHPVAEGTPAVEAATVVFSSHPEGEVRV